MATLIEIICSKGGINNRLDLSWIGNSKLLILGPYFTGDFHAFVSQGGGEGVEQIKLLNKTVIFTSPMFSQRPNKILLHLTQAGAICARDMAVKG